MSLPWGFGPTAGSGWIRPRKQREWGYQIAGLSRSSLATVRQSRSACCRPSIEAFARCASPRAFRWTFLSSALSDSQVSSSIFAGTGTGVALISPASGWSLFQPSSMTSSTRWLILQGVAWTAFRLSRST